MPTKLSTTMSRWLKNYKPDYTHEQQLKYWMLAAFVALLMLANGQAFADPLLNAHKQRIGNYDVEMVTEPKSPVAGNPANILIRIAGVNGDDLVDVPISLRIIKDGVELVRTNPIIVPYGHHTHEFTFSGPGKYVVYVDLIDNSYSGETLTFTFFVNVAGPFDYFYISTLSVTLAVIGAVGTFIVMRRRKKKQLSKL
jgi:hypothetical protein